MQTMDDVQQVNHSIGRRINENSDCARRLHIYIVTVDSVVGWTVDYIDGGSLCMFTMSLFLLAIISEKFTFLQSDENSLHRTTLTLRNGAFWEPLFGWTISSLSFFLSLDTLNQNDVDHHCWRIINEVIININWKNPDENNASHSRKSSHQTSTIKNEIVPLTMK